MWHNPAHFRHTVRAGKADNFGPVPVPMIRRRGVCRICAADFAQGGPIIPAHVFTRPACRSPPTLDAGPCPGTKNPPSGQRAGGNAVRFQRFLFQRRRLLGLALGLHARRIFVNSL